MIFKTNMERLLKIRGVLGTNCDLTESQLDQRSEDMSRAMKCHGNAVKMTCSHGISSQSFQGPFWRSIVGQMVGGQSVMGLNHGETLCSSMEFHGRKWNPMEEHGIPSMIEVP